MRFTLKDLLRCMTLSALGVAGVAVMFRIDWCVVDRNTPPAGVAFSFALPSALNLFFVSLIPAGIGALFHRARLGFFIGAAIVLVGLVVFTLPLLVRIFSS